MSRIPANSWALTRQVLAPPGASAIRLCRYSGFGADPRLRLIRSVLRTDASLVAELLGKLDRLPAAPGAFSCPADDGSEIILLLAYPDGHAVTVSVGLTGCERVTNGSAYRTAATIGAPPAVGPQLLAQLKRLTGPPTAATQMRPPAPLLSTLGASRSATIVSYCWTQPLRGGVERGTCADGTVGHPDHTLQWRPGAPVTIDLRLPARDVHIQAVRIAARGRPLSKMLVVRVRRLGRDDRRWIIRLPVCAERDNDLLISATFTHGDVFAELGLERQLSI